MNEFPNDKKIDLKEGDGEADYTNLAEYLEDEESSKLLPDLDFDKVRLNKKL